MEAHLLVRIGTGYPATWQHPRCVACARKARGRALPADCDDEQEPDVHHGENAELEGQQGQNPLDG